MFVSSGQTVAFIYCIAFGVVMGLCYFGVTFLKKTRLKSWIKILIDCVFFTVFAFVYFLFSVTFELPDFRVYMLLGVAVGFYFQNITFNNALAKLIKTLYNRKSKGEKSHDRL